ncbi:hypothetical protein EJ05DRAFT_477289 [Pseudovirgaria hyperparasitica]|uniref:C2 domain-containing protein n=1 Tax=Pseudovirgaria hyperparasitica TaxID=470096 RepID=A0A6A6W4U8_9PEZI|nr:uncharacterized protein EJ05DRAFT_477289 [Pseudovirgaria hyperparasitica]KAF2757064.1 hypothetical protein EJ05DRAFT_477289 [Pseudovirgaria hyperparasitica]
MSAADNEKLAPYGATREQSQQGGGDGKGEKESESAKKSSEEGQPEGGFDDTPVPYAPPGYTLKITFHRAKNLPMADYSSFSSDPYVLAQLNTGLQTRHKEDPPLRMRSFTVRKECDPVWNFEWVVANVPASGAILKARLYDEDPADHDDRLGNVHVTIPPLDEHWEGIKDHGYKLRKRMGSKRAYLIRWIAVCISQQKHINGYLYISIEMLGKTPGESGGKCYTLRPNWFTKHYSPLLGRIANRKESRDLTENNIKPKAQRYNFQANQLQLEGPVPDELYHRYVEFRPLIKSGFTKKGFMGFLFNKALHHQHARVYNFDRSTVYGILPDKKSITQKFLELVHFDNGGRIYTYVLTLDSLLRFTETGKEFGVDMLSKHTMHSDVSIYIAFSGEFFIRRLKHRNRAPPEEGGENTSHPPNDIDGGPPDEDPPTDPSYYELVIDNDSGTYRPNAATLPKLKEFLHHNLPGLHVVTLDCQKDADRMQRMKDEQRERKKREGDHIVFTQLSRSSSTSSSDEEALEQQERDGEERDQNLLSRVKKDAAMKGQSKMEHLKGLAGGSSTHKGHQAAEPVGDESVPPK